MLSLSFKDRKNKTNKNKNKELNKKNRHLNMRKKDKRHQNALKWKFN